MPNLYEFENKNKPYKLVINKYKHKFELLLIDLVGPLPE